MLLGKEPQVRLAISCLLAGGHLLIEDRPGMGKSTLAEALARAFALAFKRVSFTSDLLPADLTCLNVFNIAEASFRFQPGLLFTQVLLADEINRASPRTQSALLEAMAARVSVDGVIPSATAFSPARLLIWMPFCLISSWASAVTTPVLWRP